MEVPVREKWGIFLSSGSATYTCPYIVQGSVSSSGHWQPNDSCRLTEHKVNSIALWSAPAFSIKIERVYRNCMNVVSVHEREKAVYVFVSDSGVYYLYNRHIFRVLLA